MFLGIVPALLGRTCCSRGILIGLKPRRFVRYGTLPDIHRIMMILHRIAANPDHIVAKPGNKCIIAISTLEDIVPVGKIR